MNMRVWAICVAALVLLCCEVVPGQAQTTGLSAALREAVTGNIAAYDREDVDGTMRFVHTRSPDYETTKAALGPQFAELDVTSELVNFEYIGHDDEFAVGRAKVKTTGKPGSGFTDNTVDAILIFHQENGVWKLWDEKILGIQTTQ